MTKSDEGRISELETAVANLMTDVAALAATPAAASSGDGASDARLRYVEDSIAKMIRRVEGDDEADAWLKQLADVTNPPPQADAA